MMRSIILSTMLSLTGPTLTSAQVDIQDSLALVALYDATNGDQWKNNTNWLSGPVSTWHGIYLLGDRVYVINLYDNGLEGFIPPDIGQLMGLVEIDLSRGNFSGGIPNVFSDMPNFYQLSLRECGLTGEIPSSLSSCSQLGRINLNGNQLTGTIPSSLAACTELIHLLLRGNNLSGPFPPVIESFVHLEQLELSGNEFSGSIPAWIASLEDLWWLFLEDVPFSGPIPFLGDKPNLEYLSIRNNTCTGRFEDIFGAYPNLKYGVIENTRISGHLATAHFNPAKIISLEAGNNEIESMGNFSAWPNQPGFQRLEVNDNRLDFDDLLPNSSLPPGKFLYAPQKPIGTDTIVTLLPGEAYAIYSPMQDENIVYQWYFNQMLIEGLENFDLILPPFTPELAGDFFFTATHASLPNLTMQSAITTLVEGTTSLDEAGNMTVDIFPNPTADYLHIRSESTAPIQQIQLYNSTGQLIQHYRPQKTEFAISMRDYAPGVYFLRWTTSMTQGINEIFKY